MKALNKDLDPITIGFGLFIAFLAFMVIYAIYSTCRDVLSGREDFVTTRQWTNSTGVRSRNLLRCEKHQTSSECRYTNKVMNV